MPPVSFEAYAIHRPSGENCAFRTVHLACNSGLATRSGQETDHSSFPFPNEMYLLSRDQSQVLANVAAPKSAVTCSSGPEPSAFLRRTCMPSLRFALNRI